MPIEFSLIYIYLSMTKSPLLMLLMLSASSLFIIYKAITAITGGRGGGEGGEGNATDQLRLNVCI